MLAYLRSWDQFGQPVGLTINGESEFKTLYGSAASILLAGYMLYVLVIAYTPVFSREIETSFTSIIRYDDNDYSEDKTAVYFDPFAHGFSFAVGFKLPLSDEIGTLELSYISVEGYDED